jgi:hypothetical protein
MNKTVLVQPHEANFLEQGWFLALGFREGWMVVRVLQKTWSTLQPWVLGPVAAGGNLATYNEIQDISNRHYLEPYTPGIIYHTFWGVTPTQAQIKWQYPVRTDLGSILNVARTLTDNVGLVDGHKSPFWGPYSEITELFTVRDQYPAFQVYNPTSDPITNVMLNFEQRQYTYSIVNDKPLIKDLLTGTRKVKKYTMGTIPLQLEAPGWLSELVTDGLLKYSLNIMSGKVA